MKKDKIGTQERRHEGDGCRITSLAAWSPEIAWQLLTAEEQELFCRYHAALQGKQHEQPTLLGATAVKRK